MGREEGEDYTREIWLEYGLECSLVHWITGSKYYSAFVEVPKDSKYYKKSHSAMTLDEYCLSNEITVVWSGSGDESDVVTDGVFYFAFNTAYDVMEDITEKELKHLCKLLAKRIDRTRIKK